jgi:hypothetical protein
MEVNGRVLSAAVVTLERLRQAWPGVFVHKDNCALIEYLLQHHS